MNDVFPIENGDFPASHVIVFRGVKAIHIFKKKLDPSWHHKNDESNSTCDLCLRFFIACVTYCYNKSSDSFTNLFLRAEFFVDGIFGWRFLTLSIVFLWCKKCLRRKLRSFLNQHPSGINFDLKTTLAGGWTNPLKKYARQNGSFPKVRVKITNIWNHHLGDSLPSANCPIIATEF